jgi:hypothetical protein
MVKKIYDREIITCGKAAKKYADSNFVFIITENIDYCGDDSKGYVIYTYNNPSELSQIPKDEIDGKEYGLLHGYAADPEPQVGGVYYG